MTGPDHYRAAAQAGEASVFAYQRWGVSGDNRDYKSAAWELGMAQLNAALALAAATADLLAADERAWQEAIL